MNRTIKLVIIAVTVVFISVTASYLTYSFTKTNIAYVNVSKLYADFRMTQELDAKVKKGQGIRKNIMDSLYMELESLQRQLLSSPKDVSLQNLFSVKSEDFRLRQQRFGEDEQEEINSLTAQIYKQINQYMDDFKKENDYDLILGAGGEGAIMAANDQFEVTKQALDYINEKYKGVK